MTHRVPDMAQRCSNLAKPLTFKPREPHRIQPSRPGVLLFHCLTGTSTELKLLATQLQRDGYDVCCPLIDGLDGGTDPKQKPRWQDWMAQAEIAYADFASRCNTVHVGGLRAGALVALQLAATPRAKLGHLILLKPTLRANDWQTPTSLHLLNLLHTRWFARYFSFTERQPFEIKNTTRTRQIGLEGLQRTHTDKEHIFQINGVKLSEFRRFARHTHRVIADVHAPTLIIHAREDNQAPLKSTSRILRKLSGSVEMCVLCDNNQAITLDRERHHVARSVLRFLKPKSYLTEDISLDLMLDLESA